MNIVSTAFRFARRALVNGVTDVATAGATLAEKVIGRPSVLAEAEQVVTGPADVDDVPTVAEVEKAAEAHEDARTTYNEGARGKRAARKVLDRAVSGIYGSWVVSWVQPNRREWDRAAIEKVFADLGREIPTKPAAPQLKLMTLTEAPAELVDQLQIA